MSIKEILNNLHNLADKKGYSEPFIVGGTPRDKILGILDKLEDIDITTGDDTVHSLAKDYADTYAVDNYKVLKDGHAQIIVDGFKIDFSSNFKAPGIERMLQRAGVKEPTDMLMELLSRDFTCNALIMTTDLKNINDPTGLGLNDIKDKKLRTCLPSRFTFRNDNKRVVRVLYLAAKLDFDVDSEIIEWVTQNPESIANVKPKYLSDKLQKAMDYNSEKTVELLDKMHLWQFVPAMDSLIPYMNAERLNKTAKKKTKRVDLDVRPYPNPIYKNYDYTSEGPNDTSPGGSPWYGTPGGGEKSLGDWIKKRRKKTKQRRKKLEAFVK